MKEYNIAQLSGQCSTTHRALEPGEEFYAVLFELADGFERRDFCLDAWHGPPDGHFSYWKSRVPKKESKQKLLVSNEVMIGLFERLADRKEDVKQHFRFVLALILMRKKLLKYEHTVREDNAEYWVMRLPREQDCHHVLNPRMSDEQVEAVSKELGAILHGDPEAFAQFDDQTTDSDQAVESQQASEQVD